jgi:hypothetical protein
MRTPAQWLRRMKRRRPGVYAYRTDRHLAAGREWGYVGKARHLPSREQDHQGLGRWTHPGQPCPNAPRPCSHGTKGWMDLRPRRYALELPWWLGFDFITLSLETLVILALRPRYNWQKNPRKDKVGPRTQALQRAERDALRLPGGAGTEAWSTRGTSPALWAYRVISVAVILTGLIGFWVTR